MDKEVAALLLTVVVHLLGMAALIWALVLDDDDRPDLRGWRGWFGGEDDVPPDQPTRPTGPDGLPIPLPDAAPSPVRLREAGRLADVRRRPPRRPEHAPEPEPRRTPDRV